MEKETLFQTVAKNALFVVEFLGIIAALFVIAFVLEKLIQKRNGVKEKFFTTRKIAVIGVFSAISAVVMLFEIPLFFAPSFYKLDFSELPILVCSFAYGPAVGVMMEFVKILLKLVMKGTSTAFIGELANFAVGCSLIIPASLIYTFKKTKVNAIVACAVGTVILTIFGTAFNAIYLLPAFAKYYGMPMEALIGMGAKVNKLVKDGNVWSMVAACVAPLNLIKGLSVSIVTILIYKPLGPILKSNSNSKKANNVNNGVQ